MKGIIYFSLAIMFALTGVLPAFAVDTFSCIDVTEIPQVECVALVALYNSTNGSSWSVNFNWLITTTPSNWWGVTVTSGHVRSLDLSSTGLNGTIPPALGNLHNLQKLVFPNNQLNGTIPPELGNLIGLMELNLLDNQLSGSIPPTLYNLYFLQRLYVNHNQLTGNIPPEISNLINLMWLDMSYNQLSGSIPFELGNLQLLQGLYLNNNQLTGSIPPELGNLTWLMELNLSNNQLSGSIPPELGNLPVSILFLYNNQLSGSIPPELGNLTWLMELNLSNNQLSGSIPSELGNLHVRILFLYNNQLSGSIPAEQLVRNGSLRVLSLSFNQLTGSIPPYWGDLSDLDLSHNRLSSNIPPEIGYNTYLQNINLSYNRLSGTIPPELSNIRGFLFLNNNQLSGSIPDLGMEGQGDLDLSHNQLSGSIPPKLCVDWGNQRILRLNNNQLVGDIPGCMVYAHFFDPGMAWDGGDGLDLDYNYLNVPAGYPDPNNPLHVILLYKDPDWHLRQMAHFTDCSSIAEIPETECEALLALYNTTNGLGWSHSANWLVSNTPSNWYGVAVTSGHVTSINMSINQLSGAIPPELGNLSSLSVLWLQDNQLSDDIPATLANLVNLYSPGQYLGKDGLDLDYNMLNIPPGYPDLNIPLQVFLHQKDPDWQLYQGFEQVIGAGGGEIISLDSRTDFVFPPSAVISDTTFTFLPRSSPTRNHSGPGFARNSFRLTAEDVFGNPVTSFNLPVTTTLTYMDTDYGGMDEDSLGLYYWDEDASSWADTVTTCLGGEYIRNLDGNILALPLCHLTEFGLFGEPLHILLPVINR